MESNQTRELLCPEMTQLLSSLQPGMFAQIKGFQLQPPLTSVDGMATLITVDSCSPPGSSSLLHPTGRLIANKSLFSHGHTFQDSSSPTRDNSTGSPLGEQPVPDQRDHLATASSIAAAKAIEQEVHQILLGDAHPIPMHATGSAPALKNPESIVSPGHVGHDTKEQTVSSEAEEFRAFQGSSVT